MTNSATADQPVNLSLSSRSSVFFWMGFWVLFAKFFLQATVFVAVEGAFAKVLLLFGCAFLAFRVAVLFLEGHSSGLGIIGICLGTVSYVLSGESVLLTTSLLLTAAYEIDPQSILKCWSRAVTAIIVLMIWTYVIARLMGVTIGLQWSDIGGLSSNRSALFFIHPNYCAAVGYGHVLSNGCTHCAEGNRRRDFYECDCCCSGFADFGSVSPSLLCIGGCTNGLVKSCGQRLCKMGAKGYRCRSFGSLSFYVVDFRHLVHGTQLQPGCE